jgi:prolyl-tRNA synthetase
LSNYKNESITSMDIDFAKWYTDTVKKAELADYSSVKGCMIIRPYGYKLWERVQVELDSRFKETGHENVYMPMFIPEGLLQKEKEHVEGFAPEVAWVTQGGDEKLDERLCVRPTSETLFCEHYAKIIQSYRDLPKLYNQWCSVVRWEKTTRPFLRSTEFLWQEGHTAHATIEEANEETLRMLDLYERFCEDVLAIPVIKGRKTEREKFAGAKQTYTIESMMHDGKALQSATSHNFGTGFAEAFDIKYIDNNNKLNYVAQTSWGISTRIIGAIIMVHGDDNGLMLPPSIAPMQIVIAPIAIHKGGVLQKALQLKELLSSIARVHIDVSDKTPGFKFAEYEVKGVPLRLEIGPKDIASNSVVASRRDTGEKKSISMNNILTEIPKLLRDIQLNMYNKALAFREGHTYVAYTMQELLDISNSKQGFIKVMLCDDMDCEARIRNGASLTTRCISFEKERLSDSCIVCGKNTNNMLYLAKAY